ncbi:BQ5605_C018g08755 [Microbotryum silenes-dioicae]|uniref:BQ5605_C018g08755 protein n=1 Tax=Microbotryum silenes-dioicae TaxID=796604 RepID=A0A2X0P0E6_9BASI|nr:BQ5605_C018g08755 [Microbotryum silenes-dioicae]
MVQQHRFLDQSSDGPGTSPESSRSVASAERRIATPLEFETVVEVESKVYHVVMFRLATYALLVFATIWGVLARLGLLLIGRAAQSQVFPLIWAQMAGCLVMGVAVSRKSEVEHVYMPWFSAVGAGFCGSLTTFSSWMFYVFAEFSNLNNPSSGRFHGFLSGFANTVITLSASFMSLVVGHHIAQALPQLQLTRRSERAQQKLMRRHCFAIVLGIGSYIGAILLLVLGPRQWRHRATFAIVLGPPGTLLRFELGKHLNARSPDLPLGTLSANALSDLVFALVSILQRRGGTSSSITCSALQGLEDGFCGSLSTVSTLMVELHSLRRADAYRYFFLSWTLGQAILVFVLGSYIWSGDRGGPCLAS